MVLKYLIPLLILSSTFAEVQEDIQVNATKLQTSLSNIPASIGLIQSEDIENMQAQNLDELLALIPGVNANESPRSSGQRIQIRGINSSKIIVLIDGARQNFRNSHNSGLLVNQDLIKKVEVMKGPSSSLYGSGAVGGLVSFETKSASDFLKENETVGAILKGSFRTANNLHRENIMAFGTFNDFEILSSISYSHAQNIKTGDGNKLEYSGSEEKSAFIKLENTENSKHHIQLSYENMNTEAKEPSNPSEPLGYENALVINNSKRKSATLRYKRNIKSDLINPHLTTYFSSTDINKDNLSTLLFEDRNVKTTGLDLFNNSKVFSNSLMTHTLTYGFEYVKDKHDGMTPTGDLGTFPDGEGSSIGIFFQDKISLFQDLSIIPGLRYDSYKIESKDLTNPTHDDSETSAKFALSYNLTENFTVFTNYAEGFSAPRLQDLYVNGLHFPDYDGPGPASDNYFVSNPNLKAERTKTYELGLKTALSDLISDDAIFFETTVFKTKARDFIKREVDFTSSSTSFKNVTNADFKGFEAKVGYETEVFLTQLNYSQVRSEDQDSSQPLNDTPADEWNLNIKYSFSEMGVSIGYNGVYAEAQKNVDTTNVRSKDLPYLMTNSYNIHNVFISWNPKFISDSQFIIKANNIFDKSYRKHTTPVQMPGRDIQTTFKLRF